MPELAIALIAIGYTIAFGVIIAQGRHIRRLGQELADTREARDAAVETAEFYTHAYGKAFAELSFRSHQSMADIPELPPGVGFVAPQPLPPGLKDKIMEGLE